MNFRLDTFNVNDIHYDEDGYDEYCETVVIFKVDNETIFDIHNNGISRWWNISTLDILQPSVIGVDLEGEV